MDIKDLKIKQQVYWTRISKKLGVYELLDLTIRTIKDSWISTYEDRTKQSYIFSKKDIGRIIFTNRNEALNILKERELADK